MSDPKLDHQLSQSSNAELAVVKSQVLVMGGLVDQQLQRAVQALVTHDVRLAEEVAEDDHKINAMEVEIDEECSRIIALRAPAAADLRLAISVIKTITDLERIGDEAERVALRVLDKDNVGLDPITLNELEALGDMVRLMLSQSLNAFARNDAKLAYKTAKKDRSVDQKYVALTKHMTALMVADPGNIGPCIAAMWAARSLERIGDRSQNICEYVIYLVGGKDVRHTTPKRMKAAAKEAAARNHE